MKVEDLKQFSVDELKNRIYQWKDELCRYRFKTQSSESSDTSVLGKLKKDIARGYTVLNEKLGKEGRKLIEDQKQEAGDKDVK